jgi:hypothetical protein
MNYPPTKFPKSSDVSLADMSDGPPFPTDPLEALGDSLFTYTLLPLPYQALATIPSVCKVWRDHSLAYKSGLWRAV